MSPDVGTCADCLKDFTDPANRRFGYPFTNCTNCGPRFTIIRDIPYDRPFTTMAAFEMCQTCLAEYHDPTDRRFHAQPNACSECGTGPLWSNQADLFRILSLQPERHRFRFWPTSVVFCTKDKSLRFGAWVAFIQLRRFQCEGVISIASAQAPQRQTFRGDGA